MRKSDIERLAKRHALQAERDLARVARAITPQTRKQATERTAMADGVDDTPKSADAPQCRSCGQCCEHLTRDDIKAAIRDVLLEVGPILARLAAADTVHTCERPPRVFGTALVEAQMAEAVLAEAGVLK